MNQTEQIIAIVQQQIADGRTPLNSLEALLLAILEELKKLNGTP